ncbi:hypothetical protein TNCV_4914361 [Trichonephila clavipes]|nr:hypothetical protein TNCV_4914361 [Trichonephila clavipes]
MEFATIEISPFPAPIDVCEKPSMSTADLALGFGQRETSMSPCDSITCGCEVADELAGIKSFLPVLALLASPVHLLTAGAFPCDSCMKSKGLVCDFTRKGQMTCVGFPAPRGLKTTTTSLLINMLSFGGI